MSEVNILLSTYNGERYLAEQIDSILNQTYDDFKVRIRDDGSQDNTVSIIQSYVDKYPDKIIYIQDGLGNVGVSKSFEILMKRSEASFYFFADQDDIWSHNKIEVMMKSAMQWNDHVPIVCFSDLLYFQKSTNESFTFLKACKISQSKINKGLFRGTIPGCAMMFNDACKKHSLKLHFDDTRTLHDYNIFMTATLLGQVFVINDILIKHRIHSNNVIGRGKREDKLVLFKTLIRGSISEIKNRNLILETYYTYIDGISPYLDKKLRLKKELFQKKEINSLSWLKRKNWFYNHFNPFQNGIIEGVMKTLIF